MGRKEPPDKPCGCGGPLYEGHAMHTLACPKLTAPKPHSIRWPRGSNASDRLLIERLSAALTLRWKASKLTQAEFAKTIGENRTTISHIINCTSPSTTNPVFKSMGIIQRVDTTLRNTAPRPRRARPTAMTASTDLRSAFGDFINKLDEHTRAVAKAAVHDAIKEAKEAKAASTAKPRVVMKGPDTETPTTSVRLKVRQIWRSKDKRQRLVRIVALHDSKNPKQASVRVEDARGTRQSQSRMNSFLARYEFVSGSLVPSE